MAIRVMVIIIIGYFFHSCLVPKFKDIIPFESYEQYTIFTLEKKIDQKVRVLHLKMF